MRKLLVVIVFILLFTGGLSTVPTFGQGVAENEKSAVVRMDISPGFLKEELGVPLSWALSLNGIGISPWSSIPVTILIEQNVATVTVADSSARITVGGTMQNIASVLSDHIVVRLRERGDLRIVREAR